MSLSEKQQRFVDEFEAHLSAKMAQPVGSYKKRSEVERPKGYVLLDVETTGIDTYKDKTNSVIQIALRSVDADGQNAVDFSTLVHPGAKMPSKEASEINGITPDMLEDAPKFADIIEQITLLMEGKVFTAHNAKFDLAMVQKEFLRAGFGYEPSGVACTVKALRLLEPDREDHKLEEWAKEHGHAHDAHDAAEDVAAMYHYFMHLLGEDIAPESVTLDEGLYFLKKSKESTEAPTDKQMGRVFWMAKRSGWVKKEDRRSVDNERLRRLNIAINQKPLDVKQMSRWEMSRLMEALDFVEDRRQARIRRELEKAAQNLS